jgi:hypothetical protein
MEALFKLGLQVAGISQLMLFFMSFAIPKALQWSERTASLLPFMRQMFFTYAVYILYSHLFFALISLFLVEELLSGSSTGLALLVFMALWWSGRIFCQFFYFDREGIPDSPFNRIAEGILVTMFFCLIIVYWGGAIWVMTEKL